MLPDAFWGDGVVLVVVAPSKRVGQEWAEALRGRPDVGRVRTFQRTLRAGGAKADVWVIVCYQAREAKGGSDVE